MKILPALLVAAVLTWAALPARAAPEPPAHVAVAVAVSHAWIRVLPGTLPAGGYATLTNTGDTPAALTGASSPAYQHVMLHKSSTRGGMSGMHMVEQLPIPAHATVTLAPGGYHLMLTDATHPVTPGDAVPVTLHFADGSSMQVDFLARPANAH